MKTFSSFLGCALSLFGLIGCGKKSAVETAPSASAESAGPRAVKLALDWVPEPEFGGFYAAREDGAYARHGIRVEIQGGGAGVPVLQMVATGRADFGTVGADEVITARARGADVVALFAVFQTSPQGIMVHASRKLQKLEDAFHSGTLALETGLAYAAFLKKKFSWEGVKVVPYDGGVAHFLSDPNFGQQCFVTSEPISARQKGGDPQVFLIADSGFNPYGTVVVTRRELLQKNPTLVKSFVLATREGWRDYLDHPEATNALLGKLNSALDAATLATAAAAEKPLIDSAEIKTSGLGSMQRARWQTLDDQLLDLKIIDKPQNVDELFVSL
ncbi:MAG TPA: ABC transporter substrate-binding protein [Polyangiaceae bacterium]|nr:ABC transporter substrate-binding protein [Polyangiaceae bacterium]